MDKIVCLKLSSGEEVMGKIFNENGVVITIKDVASIVMMPTSAQGQVGLGLMPFLPYADGSKFDFYKDKILVQFEAGVDMLNNYNRMFGSGIQIAKTI